MVLTTKKAKKKTAKRSPSSKNVKSRSKKISTPKKTIVKSVAQKSKLKTAPKGGSVSSRKKAKRIVKKKITRRHKAEPRKLQKAAHNPIIAPTPYSWESKATFNPSAFQADGKIHIIYRAVGDDDSSAFGYASSVDGLTINDRPTYFVYRRFIDMVRSGPRIDYLSGGGGVGGCEDPRITFIDNTIYMLYTAFDGWGSVRIALTSMKLDDFKNKKWNWKQSVLISPPGQINKNWVLFPEKINGKFAILHSFYPKILIDYFDDLDELDGKNFIQSDNTRPIDPSRTWDSWFRGVGPAPIRIKEGWLVLYHAMDYRNPDRYRMGALILDSRDPTKILYRSSHPILEPEESYENNGDKWGVVYSCGAVVKDGTLFVYYGGSDKFVCAASMPLANLVRDLKNNSVSKLKNT
jgi:predicted GH43/DUF377 family glycosyl hydrolase